MIEKKFGIVVPLGALYTEKNNVIGEFADLVNFSDFCVSAGISIIQLLPLNDSGTQNSPYSGLSAFALHHIYIRISDVLEFSELYSKNSQFAKKYDDFVKKFKYESRYDYQGISCEKESLLRFIFEQTEIYKNSKPEKEFSLWIQKNPWVKVYSVYKNLKYKYMQASWKSWNLEDQKKTEDEIETLWNEKSLLRSHLFYAWVQFVAENQFLQAVKSVRKKGIIIKGDMPILMNEDSADAWAYPEFFNQSLRAGAPAQGEEVEGQNWGFPTYNWKNLKSKNYSWWIERLKNAQKFYDAYRLDHILGFFRIWAIPENDCNALNGHTEPFAAIKKDVLYESGFDDDRIRWLSEPHVPTHVIEDITWNHEAAHKILEIVANRIENEELWLFKKNISGSNFLKNLDFGNLCTKEAAVKIREILVQYYSNKTLLEISKNKYLPMWTYNSSTSWKSLNENEKKSLLEIFSKNGEENDKLWKKQSDEILGTLTSSVKMIPCGEDLGVSIECMPFVMKKNGILGLRVVRWCRKWNEENQPFEPMNDYEKFSVTTTSVHDSSTLRQWWLEEKQSCEQFVKENKDSFGINCENENELNSRIQKITGKDFNFEIAEKVLKACAKTSSLWFVPPLQDLLYLEDEYYLKNPKDERINIPGTVNEFNWTYRIPVSIEKLCKNKNLISKIKAISDEFYNS